MKKETGRRWEAYNANPERARVGDCVVRAISAATGQNWEKIYMDLCIQGLLLGDMPTANHVWGSYLRGIGYRRAILGDDCTVQQFAAENPEGTYILAMPSHVVAVKNGRYLDSWDCGDEVPVYFWRKEEEKR